MECRTTTINDGGRSQRGATLAEYVIAVAVGSLLVAAVCAFSLFAGRSFAAYNAYMDLDLSNRRALDQMTKDFRSVLGLTNITDNSIIMLDVDGQPLTYIYDPTNMLLRRIKLAKTTVLLKNCDRLQFTMNMRNMSNGTFMFFPTTNVFECKAISVDWACTRKFLGVQTEDMPQTATIVIRNN